MVESRIDSYIQEENLEESIIAICDILGLRKEEVESFLKENELSGMSRKDALSLFLTEYPKKLKQAYLTKKFLEIKKRHFSINRVNKNLALTLRLV